jgi:hypothetical protein
MVEHRMGFFDAFRKKKTTSESMTSTTESKPQQASQTSSSGEVSSQAGRRIKKYTSEGKPIYE